MSVTCATCVSLENLRNIPDFLHAKVVHEAFSRLTVHPNASLVHGTHMDIRTMIVCVVHLVNTLVRDQTGATLAKQAPIIMVIVACNVYMVHLQNLTARLDAQFAQLSLTRNTYDFTILYILCTFTQSTFETNNFHIHLCFHVNRKKTVVNNVL